MQHTKHLWRAGLLLLLLPVGYIALRQAMYPSSFGVTGFYRFDITIECPAEVVGAIEPPLYLLMNVYDGYQVERPTENRFRGAIGLLGSGRRGGSSDNDSDPDDSRVVGPGLPEIPDDIRYPDHPVYPPTLPSFDQPPIPEPATLALTGLGLGLAALLRRRRH